jgi:DinB superfamily
MRYIRFIPVACLLAACIAPAFAQSGTSPKPSVTAEFQRFVSGPERGCLALANAMPADRYAFVPSNGEFRGVRSFAQLAKHIAVDNYLAGAALLGEKPPIDPGLHENGPESIQSKAEIMKFLRDSFAYLHKGMAKVNEKNLLEMIDYPGGGRVTRLAVIASAISHPWDIYGQMIEYLRMNGIDPQATKPAE